MKICSSCYETKPEADFSKHIRARDGLRSECKACNAAYYAANSGRIKAGVAVYRAANSENMKARKAAYRDVNREKIKAGNAAYCVANRAQLKTSRSAYRAANRDSEHARAAAWRAANSDRLKARKAANRKAYRIYEHNRRARTAGKLSNGIAEKLFELQRGKCACCKQPLGDNYHLDHILPLALGGTNTDGNIQLLRSTCNQQKYAKHPVDFMQQRGFLL